MAPDLAPIIERMTYAQADALASEPCPERLQALDDVLTEGYAWALDADAWCNAEEQRLHDVISDASRPVRGQELRQRATAHARVQHDLIKLRRALSDLRRERDRLRSGVGLSA